MLHVRFGLLDLFTADDFFDPARIQIDEIARAPPHVGQMLDRQAQPPWTGRAHHQPIMIARKMFVRNFFRELAVIHLVIVPTDALLGHAGRAAGLEDIKWPPLECFWDPDFRLQIAQPFVLKMREARQISELLYFRRRVPTGFPGPIEPERAAGVRRKMPLHDFACMGVEFFLGGLDRRR